MIALRSAFVLNCVLLALHEMDAVYWKEWRIFGIADDVLGRKAFLLVHVLIFGVILSALVLMDRAYGKVISLLMGAFLVVHFFLHQGSWAQGYFVDSLSSGIIAAMLLVSLAQIGLTVRACRPVGSPRPQ